MLQDFRDMLSSLHVGPLFLTIRSRPQIWIVNLNLFLYSKHTRMNDVKQWRDLELIKNCISPQAMLNCHCSQERVTPYIIFTSEESWNCLFLQELSNPKMSGFPIILS